MPTCTGINSTVRTRPSLLVWLKAGLMPRSASGKEPTGLVLPNITGTRSKGLSPLSASCSACRLAFTSGHFISFTSESAPTRQIITATDRLTVILMSIHRRSSKWSRKGLTGPPPSPVWSSSDLRTLVTERTALTKPCSSSGGGGV